MKNKIFYYSGIFICSLVILELFLNIIPVEERLNNIENDMIRILCVGDSVTYGPGCDEKDSFPVILEKLLNKEKEKYKVYNLGKPGMETNEAFLRIKEYIELYRPYALTLMVGACNSNISSKYSEKVEISGISFFERLKILKVLRLIYMKITGYSENLSENAVLQCEFENIIFPDINKFIEKDIKNSCFDIDEFYSVNTGWEFLYKNDFRKAEDFFIRNMSKIENIYGLIYIYGNLGDYVKAQKLTEDYLVKYPENPILHYFLGMIKGETGEFSQSLKSFTDGLLLSPSDITIITGIGYVTGLTGNFEKAIEYLQKSLDIDSGYGPAYNFMGNYYREMGNLQKASQVFLLGTQSDPLTYQNFRDLGYLYAASEEHGKAVEWFEKAIKINPYDYDSYRGCAFSLLDSSDNTELIKSQEYFILSDKLNPLRDRIESDIYMDLKKIYDYCVENNVKIYLMNYPQAENPVMRRISRDLDIPYIDIFSEFSSRVDLDDDFPNKFFISGKVCSPEGNRIIADKILEIFRKDSGFTE